MRTLIHSIGELVTLEPLALSKRTTSITTSDLGLMHKAWLLIEDGLVHSTGTTPPPVADNYIDAMNGLVMPGFVDSHTHPLFAGNRVSEFADRLNGMTYQEIAQRGGGIRSTVQATRQASDHELYHLTRQRLEGFMRHGVTTIEVKTGYALSVDEELRHLRILNKLSEDLSVKLVITCLALHALPLEGSKNNYIDDVIHRLLPVAEKERLCAFVDAFIEDGYYSVADVEPYIKKAHELGLGVRLHVDEFSDQEGALAAGQWGASSADHLQWAHHDGVKAMADNGCTATLLPGTSLYTGIPFTSGRRFADAGCPVAIASDFNPGSCFISNLPLLASVAAVQGKLTAAEALAAITFVPASSLGLSTERGALAKGFYADFVVYESLSSHQQWLADMGQTLPSKTHSHSFSQFSTD